MLQRHSSVPFRLLSSVSRPLLYVAVFFYLQYLTVADVLASAGFGGPIPLIPGLARGNVRTGLVDVLKFFLSFLTLFGIIFVIVGGVRILASSGNEEQVTKGRKTVVYAIIGLLVIFFASLIVSFFTVDLATQFPTSG